ncbi:hypothetical protein EVAR_59774_1 [Eumeta japonica]|uniref:Uncharacterized protein n=1 Tax=Eumeta variegata TaxID=151549 RepID=A0A4C1ZKH2_EUMVA|nr:hypothetical protein EVAR_59774_1 [Eumeta japonica]
MLPFGAWATGTAACTQNKEHRRAPACVALISSATANYLGCPRARKRITPLIKSPSARSEPRRVRHPRAVTHKLSYAKATAEPRTDPPPQTKLTSPSENIKALMSVISIIDFGE